MCVIFEIEKAIFLPWSPFQEEDVLSLPFFLRRVIKEKDHSVFLGTHE
jgi:hypothetical protein